MDLNSKSISLRIAEASAAGEARRIAAGMAEALEFSPVKAGEIGIIVTELASNLWRHAGHGQIILRPLSAKVSETELVNGIEILSIDNGPGMADVDKCSRDGYSSGGSSGIGLGAVARLSSHSEVYSVPKQGTIVLAHVWAKPRPRTLFSTGDMGVICVPVKDQNVCGDAWALKPTPTGLQLLLVDALGHGIRAADGANEAVRIFEESHLSGTELMQELHTALRSSVGAVIGWLNLDSSKHLLSFVGVGNLEGKIFNGQQRRSIVSQNGTVGHTMQTVRQWAYEWHDNAVLILHSDGISNKWDMENYPGLIFRHSSIIAAVLYRDFRRERDDASIVVVRASIV